MENLDINIKNNISYKNHNTIYLSLDIQIMIWKRFFQNHFHLNNLLDSLHVFEYEKDKRVLK